MHPAYVYVGARNPDGTAAEFVMGLPSRDIPHDEHEAMSAEDQAALKASPVHRRYQAPKVAQAKPKDE